MALEMILTKNSLRRKVAKCYRVYSYRQYKKFRPDITAFTSMFHFIYAGKDLQKNNIAPWLISYIYDTKYFEIQLVGYDAYQHILLTT